MTQADRLMHDAHLRYQRQHAGNGRQSCDTVDAKIRAGLHRIRERLNMSQAMIDHLCFDYYKYFCQHDKLRLERCTKCNRRGIVG